MKTVNFAAEIKPGTVKNKGKLIGILAAALLVLVVFAASIAIVPAGNTGVVLTMGKVSQNGLSEGFHLKAPFVQSVKNISNKIQKLEVEADAVSKDLQTVKSKIAVNYRIQSAASAGIYKNVGMDYQAVILQPAMQESMKSVSARYTAEELITKRGAVSEEIKNTLESKVKDDGIFIEKFNIINFDFSEEFNKAIEAKQVAEQTLIKTKTEQEQAIVVAEANAKQKVITAKAEADAITTKAKAQAEANKLLTQSLNGTLVEYEKVQKWNGQMPQVSGGNAIVDFRTNSTGNQDKTDQ